MERVVDISSDGNFLAIDRGFLTINSSGVEKGRVALDDIGALIVHAHGTSWSNHVFTRLSERSVPVILCGSNHAPVACVWPLEGHYLQGARMRAQAAAPKPLTKQIWRQIVAAKVTMQGHILQRHGAESGAFTVLARSVKSGDPENIEAQAARRYWKVLFGSAFTRDQKADGPNALLNYGYTVLRAVVSRAICAAGLHPTLGIFHANRANAFALADDLMEPYRPLVDDAVLGLVRCGKTEIDPESKLTLAQISSFDLATPVGVSPLSVQVQRFVHSVATSFEQGRVQIELPSLATKPSGKSLQELDHGA